MAKLNLERLAMEKAARTGKKCNIHIVAQDLNIPDNTLWRYARGETQSIPLDRLSILLDYFDCSYHELVIEDDTAPESAAPTLVSAGAAL